MFNLFRHELFSRWISILGWGLGLTAFATMYITIYPLVAEQMQGLANLVIYQAMGVDLASFAGFIASVVVQVLPIILGIYVITVATATLAGEEENGTLELVVAMPLPRWQIVTMKAAALAIVFFLILLIMGIGSGTTLFLVQQSTPVDVTSGQLIVALLGVFPLMLAFLCMGLFLGAFLPTRRLAVAVLIVIYAGSYVLQSIAVLVESLDFVKYFSLFHYVDTTTGVFENGIDPVNVLILLAVSAVFFVLALWSFQRRNITVGQWFWQRGRVPAS